MNTTHNNTLTGGRIVPVNDDNSYGYSYSSLVISNINCNSCNSSKCSLYDCQWSFSNDSQCLSHTNDAVVECYNG